MHIKLVLKGVIKNGIRNRRKITINIQNLIVIKLEYKGVTYESKFEYLYNAKLTLDANISIIENIIDSKIILSFYKKGE